MTPEDEAELAVVSRSLAGKLDVPFLYKFRPYGTGREKRRVHEILIDHVIYFSRASQLNDPFDCCPVLEVGTSETLQRAVERFHEKNNTDVAVLERVREYFADVDPQTHRERAQASARKQIENDYWIFSLAGNRDHPMMWSHYAAGHTGLCIHFRSDEKSVFGAAQKVEYVKERPRLPVDTTGLSGFEFASRILLRKGEFWSYEDEFRWIRYPRMPLGDVPLLFDGQHAKFPGQYVAGISLGARMPAWECNEVIRIAARHSPALPVWRARGKDTFGFDFDRVA